ncbi:MAG: hypothetical protein WD271_03255 [Acidimicrobiia bacterium]
MWGGIKQFFLNLVEEKLGRAICIAAGLGIAIGAFLQAADRNSFTVVAVLCGTFLIAIGCLVDRIAKLAITLKGGLQVELHPPKTAEETTALAEQVEDDPALEHGVEAEPEDAVDLARYQLADAAVQRVMTPAADSPLSGCDLHLYLLDDIEGKLLPAFEPDELDSEGWEPGAGAVGFAWEFQDLIYATAPQTYDATFRLTGERQKRYRDLTAVAAIPVFNSAETTIAILAASSKAEDQRLTTEEGLNDLESRAAGIARLLIDLLQWFDDS